MHTICVCRPRNVNFSANDAALLGYALRKDGILTQDSKNAEISAPLTDLLKDGQWRSPSAPDVLAAAYFDVHAASTDLFCEASGGSIGAVLQQTDRDGNVRPVGFYSRKLTPAEGRYDTYDCQFVGLRDVCPHFRYQLFGSLHSPHRP
jgi:hypothetical protein